ncbi:uncharacterized protein N7483_005663 [Penicillium malachiteum]|uniref:uncharacterized protein n=1 Tax=Penicillium malachiteum TaxID=1324776 RepID=UPI002547E013|nr:uncharacterized protein N7483_005663 [Penicillium malachiteum]KAJ5731155.1 hypothetical protein N7483_005663 [Penicillium malachiteum]
MSFSIALSAAAASRPGVTRPAMSLLVSSHPAQCRSICRAARNTQAGMEKPERTSRSFTKCFRPLASIRSSFSDISSGREKTFWEAEREQMMQRMAHLKKSMSDDPSNALFSHQVESLRRMNKSKAAWSGFLQSIITTEHQPVQSDMPLKSHLQDFNFAQSPEITRDGRQYDPISGRMAPQAPQPSNLKTQTQSAQAIDCTPGGELETKFASNPSLVDEGQFQPGASVSHIAPEASLSSKTIDCSPGSELEALFTSNPASYKDVRTMTGAFQESAHKPNINIDCPPGNELEALLISESVHSGQPHAESFQPSKNITKLSADAGVSAGRTVECSPGNELDALFISKPALRADQTSSLEDFGANSLGQSNNVTVDCPPGNELEAKFVSELGSQSEKAHLKNDTVDCSSGNELEAKIISEAAMDRNEAIIDSPPGNELEAKFVADPVPVEDGQFQPSLVSDELHAQQANITLDCHPGNELEAMFISKAASGSPSMIEDLSSLQASDIRTRYASLDTLSKPESHLSKNVDYSGSEDRIGDYILKNQKTSAPEAQQEVSPIYRILTYDSSTFEITTAESDLFFGVNDTSPLMEVLSRLQNPAKFVPYFEKMQRDGYEIATGGGDILVFRKSGNLAAAEQDSAIHADIAPFLRHDSYPTASSTGSRSPFTNQPPPADESNGVGDEPTKPSSSKSSIRKTLSRATFAVTATAASCYALGVVIEYFCTGGQDGHGIDGFTAFESERRHLG